MCSAPLFDSWIVERRIALLSKAKFRTASIQTSATDESERYDTYVFPSTAGPAEGEPRLPDLFPTTIPCEYGGLGIHPVQSLSCILIIPPNHRSPDRA